MEEVLGHVAATSNHTAGRKRQGQLDELFDP